MELTPEILKRIRNNDPTLKELDLSYWFIEPTEVTILTKALSTNTTLKIMKKTKKAPLTYKLNSPFNNPA